MPTIRQAGTTYTRSDDVSENVKKGPTDAFPVDEVRPAIPHRRLAFLPMPRMKIQLTSARDDGDWTWRAEGARQPKGSIGRNLVPDGAVVGDVLRVEVDQFMDGIEVTSVLQSQADRSEVETLEIIGSGRNEPLVTSKLTGGRGRRGDDDRRGGRREDGRGQRRDGARDEMVPAGVTEPVGTAMRPTGRTATSNGDARPHDATATVAEAGPARGHARQRPPTRRPGPVASDRGVSIERRQSPRCRMTSGA